ncbi:fungal hydrophobin [Coprinopsis marcescibilis]|uniref:Hydrophobin n=1 Tax=Coprinopsis marcescibilis TaxID=230819 RepID=A0A5C3LEN7_COPMA|nr:fungal hydrophobin [Coprinopsis marcescibilis]
MQFKVIATLAALATVVVAVPTDPVTPPTPPPPPPPPPPQCSTGPIQCCNSVQQANVPAVSALLGLLGIVVNPITALVGLNCSPLTVIGIGGNQCNAQTVCCTNNSFNGLVAIGCTPINIGL